MSSGQFWVPGQRAKPDVPPETTPTVPKKKKKKTTLKKKLVAEETNATTDQQLAVASTSTVNSARRKSPREKGGSYPIEFDKTDESDDDRVSPRSARGRRPLKRPPQGTAGLVIPHLDFTQIEGGHQKQEREVTPQPALSTPTGFTRVDAAPGAVLEASLNHDATPPPTPPKSPKSPLQAMVEVSATRDPTPPPTPPKSVPPTPPKSPKSPLQAVVEVSATRDPTPPPTPPKSVPPTPPKSPRSPEPTPKFTQIAAPTEPMVVSTTRTTTKSAPPPRHTHSRTVVELTQEDTPLTTPPKSPRPVPKSAPPPPTFTYADTAPGTVVDDSWERATPVRPQSKFAATPSSVRTVSRHHREEEVEAVPTTTTPKESPKGGYEDDMPILNSTQPAVQTTPRVMEERRSYYSPVSGAAAPKAAAPPVAAAGSSSLPATNISPRNNNNIDNQQRQHYVPQKEMKSSPLPFRIDTWHRPTEGQKHASKDGRDGRVIDLEKFASRRHTNYFVSAWQQACLKYIFPGAFEEKLDVMELIAIAILFGTVILNIVMVSINVFGEQVESSLDTIRITGNIVFYFELVVVYLMFIFLVAVVLYGVWKKSYGTDFVVDVVDVAKLVASFSVLKVVRVVSVSFIQEKLVPRFTKAVSCWDYTRAVIAVLAWLVMVVVGSGAVVIKVSQVYFTGVISIEDWTLGQVLQIIGLVSNMAKVDTSYDAETAALLAAAHKHYSGPGGPDSLNPQDEGLYSLLLTKLDIQRSRSYELFESVFDYHFGRDGGRNVEWKKKKRVSNAGDLDEGEVEGITPGDGYKTKKKKKSRDRERAMKAFNFMAFILHVDNQSLRRYLQMVDSPLKYYADGAKSFNACVNSRDIQGMEMMLWRSDPDDKQTLIRGEKLPNTFRLTFTCEDPFLEVQVGEVEGVGVELSPRSPESLSDVEMLEKKHLSRAIARRNKEENDEDSSVFGNFFSCCVNDDTTTSVVEIDPPTPRQVVVEEDDGIWTPAKKLTKRTPISNSPLGKSPMRGREEDEESMSSPPPTSNNNEAISPFYPSRANRGGSTPSSRGGGTPSRSSSPSAVRPTSARR